MELWMSTDWQQEWRALLLCPNTRYVHLLLPPATPADRNRYLSRFEESAILTTIPAVFQIETRSNIWAYYNPRKKLDISLVQFCLHCTVYTGCTLYIVQLLLLNKCYICGDSSRLSPKSSNLQMKNLTFSSLWYYSFSILKCVYLDT